MRKLGAVLLGFRACGKTVFLTLLYDAMIRYSTKEEEKFRFYPEPKTVMELGASRDNLYTGGWPEATVLGDLFSFSFILGYKKMGVSMGTIGKIVSDSLQGSNFIKRYLPVRLSIYDTCGCVFEDLIRRDFMPYNIVSCQIPIFLIDLSIGCEGYGGKLLPERWLAYDREMATFLSIVLNYMAKKNSEKMIYPIFVLTKFDTVDKDVLQKIGLDEKPPAPEKGKERREYAETILEKFFKQTHKMIFSETLKDIHLEKAPFFFTGIATEQSEKWAMPMLKPTGNGGLQIAYTYEEFEAFINYIGTIARNISE